ncbi:hypothetical protein RFI_36122, partial [Reticulomyxa filosa]
ILTKLDDVKNCWWKKVSNGRERQHVLRRKNKLIFCCFDLDFVHFVPAKELLRICQSECDRLKQEKDVLIEENKSKETLIRALDERVNPLVGNAMTELSRTEQILNRSASSKKLADEHMPDARDNTDTDVQAQNHRRKLHKKRSRNEMEGDSTTDNNTKSKYVVHDETNDKDSHMPVKKKRNTKSTFEANKMRLAVKL